MREEKERLYYVQNIPVPGTPKPSHTPSAWKKTKVIGKRLPCVDAHERVSGSAVYPSDTSLPDMLYGAILRCPHAHARVLSIDTREAGRMPGVRVVITGNTPGANVDYEIKPFGGAAIDGSYEVILKYNFGKLDDCLVMFVKFAELYPTTVLRGNIDKTYFFP